MLTYGPTISGSTGAVAPLASGWQVTSGVVVMKSSPEPLEFLLYSYKGSFMPNGSSPELEKSVLMTSCL